MCFFNFSFSSSRLNPGICLGSKTNLHFLFLNSCTVLLPKTKTDYELTGVAFVQAGVTLLLINLSSQIEYAVDIQPSDADIILQYGEQKNHKTKSLVHELKESVSWIGSRSSDVKLSREEYHLTPEGGNIKSRKVLLNGRLLQLTGKGNIPTLSPVLKNLKSPVSVEPLSIKFIVFPNFSSASCR